MDRLLRVRNFAALAVCLWTVGCGPYLEADATGDPTPSVSPSLPPGLTEAEAIEAARHGSSTLRDAEVWATMPGTFEEVFAALAHRPSYVTQPPPAGAKMLDRMVWGVQFKFVAEICPPPPGDCESRDALRTILIDYMTGRTLRQSTIAPSPGDPLPTPDLAASRTPQAP
jgi:hypothetical protein